MKLDAALAIDAAHLRDVAGIVRAAEEIGFSALWTPETQHNGFFPLLLAAEHSQRIELGTAVTIAFPRSPMVMAQNAWDMQAISGGRFILGLGTQVKAHIERRYSAEFVPPGPRMKEYVESVQAIFRAFAGLDGGVGPAAPIRQVLHLPAEHLAVELLGRLGALRVQLVVAKHVLHGSSSRLPSTNAVDRSESTLDPCS